MTIIRERWTGSRPRVVVLALSMAALPAGAVMAQATSGIREAEARYAASLTSGDVEEAASFFDVAGALTMSGCSAVRGRADVRAALTGLVRSGRVVDLTPEDVTQSGPGTAREVGTFRLVGSDPASGSLNGRYATGWVKLGSDWKISVTALMPTGLGDAETLPARGGSGCALVDTSQSR